ncbi:MAG: hypothetical protein Q6363_000980 [Candidatus Njordarchaeota archaeon]
MSKTISKKKMERLEDLLANIDTYIEEHGKRLVCEKIVELSGLLDPYDERIDGIFEILGKYCGQVFIIKLKQTIKSRLVAKGSPITPDLINMLGTRVAYVINEALDHRAPIISLKSLIEKALKQYGMEKIDIAELPSFLDPYREALEVSERYIEYLEKMGVFEIPPFIEEYVKCMEKVGNKLSVDKAIIAVYPVLKTSSIKSNVFERVIYSMSENFKSFYGLSIAIGYGLIRYVYSMKSGFFAWNVVMVLLSFSNEDALLIYQKARNGDYDVIFDILSKLVGKYYRGSISKMIDFVIRGKISVDSAMKILLSTSYATLGIANIMEIMDYLNRILEVYWKKHDKIDSYVFEVINKIASEAKPAIIRRFLEIEMNRKKLIGIVEKYPSVLILSAINRLIKAYIPAEVGRKISESSNIKLNIEHINKEIPDWRSFLDVKTLIYFGVES